MELGALKPGEERRWPGREVYPPPQEETSSSRGSHRDLLQIFAIQRKVEETQLVEILIPKCPFHR